VNASLATKEEFETKWKKLNDTLTSKFDFISSKETDEVKVLKSRIADLEEKLAKSTKKVEAKKTTTKTTVAKKPAAKKTTTKKAEKVEVKDDEE
jgi:DNA topoisomerase-1